jgi:hypothetical protein
MGEVKPRPSCAAIRRLAELFCSVSADMRIRAAVPLRLASLAPAARGFGGSVGDEPVQEQGKLDRETTFLFGEVEAGET